MFKIVAKAIIGLFVCVIGGIGVVIVTTIAALIATGTIIMAFGPWNWYGAHFWYLLIIPCWCTVSIIWLGIFKLGQWAKGPEGNGIPYGGVWYIR